MNPGEWDAIWWYRDMRYPGSPCVNGLSRGPRILGRHINCTHSNSNSNLGPSPFACSNDEHSPRGGNLSTAG